MNVREKSEEKEKATLSPFAQLSISTKGRLKRLEPDPLRTCYQRDRDRIIHCKAFRRLSHKTQVFLAPEKDHYRTRLTHTLEVTQIARSIAITLNLNEDLTEAIGLGHDLGHTPFGHIGEQALSDSLKSYKGLYPDAKVPFKHNQQSLRVVDVIEYEGKGLNLTEEVRDGILNHTGNKFPETLEGQIVRLSDRIAYVNHDLEDAIRARVVIQSDLPNRLVKTLGEHRSQRINTMILDVIEASKDAEKIKMSDEIWKAMDELRDFLFEKVYENKEAKSEDPKAMKVLQSLFKYYIENPDDLPQEYSEDLDASLPVQVCDYVAGMTDRYAIRKFEEFFVPQAWML